MIKVLKLKSKENVLKSFQPSIKKPIVNNIVIFVFILLLESCGGQQYKKKEESWEYPADNLYPTIMKSVPRIDGPPRVAVELKPKSLKLDCTLRNDSPYYWCGVDGEIKNPDPKLPKTVSTVYQRVVNAKGKKASENLIKRLKKANVPVFLVAPHTYSIDNDGTLGNYMYGIYNGDECMDIWDDYSACPVTAKKFDIYTGKYLTK